MWPNREPKRSRGMGNPTSSDHGSTRTSGLAWVEPSSKDLPSLPDGHLEVAQDDNEWRYSAVSPMASPILETVNDSGSSFCVSPIDESSGFVHQEQRDSAGAYLADAQLNALYVDTPPSPAPAVIGSSPPRKKKAVAFVAVPEQIPSPIENFSPETPVLKQQTQLTGPEAPIYRDFGYHKATFQEPILEESDSGASVPLELASDEPVALPPIYKENENEPPRQQPSGVHRDLYSGESTMSTTGKTVHGNSQNVGSHKPSASASNIFNWGREQLLPIKEFAQARSRNSSFHKSEIPVPITAKDSKQKNVKPRSTSRTSPMEGHPRRPSANNASVQFSHIGMVPTTVTTITAGGSKALPQRPVPRDTNNKQLWETRYTKPLPKIVTVTEPLWPEQHEALSSATPVASKPDSPNPYPSPKDSPKESPQESPREISQQKPSAEAEPTEGSPSIMSRRRPIPPVSMPVSRKPVRKPTPAEAAQASNSVDQSSTNEPKEPMDRILALEAKRDGLARRRVNLETVIKELTHVIQPGNVVYDLAAKQEVKRSVQSIENDIAEIKREEHELGLKAARAWRRLDEFNNGDGGTLWVKRVTS
ncbi:hypothetical protein N7466_008987 [Penicillium verhagenii]|uniref:uncharacterized protein n=1 Tax=Penicillium verhagenii TaxID=1562060 RepID=UPI0025456C5A|nr:uncharacterized protein N7466_008987 [Penicillium verhagenii]KAJ5924800.1 hypothetical protein N7466_008987 [Penicillium verhagenii]